jgi:hypothetical protein
MHLYQYLKLNVQLFLNIVYIFDYMASTDYNQLIKHNLIKVIIIILLLLISSIVGVGLFTNKHIKIGIIEFNGNEIQSVKTTTDTSSKKHSDQLSDITNKRLSKKYSSKPLAVQTNKISINTPKDSFRSKYNITAPITNSTIGDGAVNNNYSPQQRISTDGLISEIINKNYHNLPIDFLTSNNSEAINFAKSIRKDLSSRGIKSGSDIIALIPFSLPGLGIQIDTSKYKFKLLIGTQQ